MTLIAPSDTVPASTSRAFAPLNIADALDLLCAAVNDRGHGLSLDPVSNPNLTDQAYPQANGDEPRCIIAHALSRAGVSDAELDPISKLPVRNLYRDGRLPIPITLGASSCSTRPSEAKPAAVAGATFSTTQYRPRPDSSTSST